MKQKKQNITRSILTFLFVLLMMPAGHALMILMEHYLDTTSLHYCAFAMGASGLVIVITGVFIAGDTKATIFGLAGGLLFWTGWVEFLFSYYAWRYGVHYDLVGSGTVQTVTEYAGGLAVSHTTLINGLDISSFTASELKALRGSRPEYLIMPATFGFWMMFCVLYLFCTKTGCRLFLWLQKTFGLNKKLKLRPITYLPSIVTFLELNVMMWSLYLALMFCYDPEFLGANHVVTYIFAAMCLAGSVMMFVRQLRIRRWGANIRMAIATVIVLWTFVEIMSRNGLLKEIWVEPLNYIQEMLVIGAGLLIIPAMLFLGRKTNQS